MKETFEKAAGEYAKPFYDMTRYDYVAERTHVKEAFLQGAKFGYKKGEKAIELLKKLLEEEKDNMYWKMNGSDKSSYYEVRKQAEQFLKGE